jgi:monovalent cation:H+ antiporter-2, CPA2 family
VDHHLDIILTLAGGLGAALIFGVVFQRLKLSPIVGYLLAGVAVGPFTPGFVAHGAVAAQFAELGVILLMFGVGAQFHIHELIAVRRVAVPGALLQVSLSAAAGAGVALLAGWGIAAGVIFGLALGAASTVVAVRMLTDGKLMKSAAGPVAMGWLVVEDLLTVFVLVLLPIILGPRPEGSSLALPVAIALAKVAALIIFTMVVGRRTIPALLAYIARLESRELYTLAVLAIVLCIAVGAAELFGASMALGSFLAGLVVGQSDQGARATADALPMRDAFSVLFFVAMGMLLDPAQLLPNAALIAASLAVVLIVTPLSAFGVARLFGASSRLAATLAGTLAQIGEFSFILAGLGTSLKILPDRATQCLVAVSIASITLSPFLLKAALKLSGGAGVEADGLLQGEAVAGEQRGEALGDARRK